MSKDFLGKTRRFFSHVFGVWFCFSKRTFLQCRYLSVILVIRLCVSFDDCFPKGFGGGGGGGSCYRCGHAKEGCKSLVVYFLNFDRSTCQH